MASKCQSAFFYSTSNTISALLLVNKRINFFIIYAFSINVALGTTCDLHFKKIQGLHVQSITLHISFADIKKTFLSSFTGSPQWWYYSGV